jgi:hypothetical protein
MMPESKTVVVPKRMHVVERLAEVQRQIAEWMDSLDEPFDKEADALHMREFTRNDTEYEYRYTIERRVRIPKRK